MSEDIDEILKKLKARPVDSDFHCRVAERDDEIELCYISNEKSPKRDSFGNELHFTGVRKQDSFGNELHFTGVRKRDSFGNELLPDGRRKYDSFGNEQQ
jgi:hypothetical protein